MFNMDLIPLKTHCFVLLVVSRIIKPQDSRLRDSAMEVVSWKTHLLGALHLPCQAQQQLVRDGVHQVKEGSVLI